uniref:t-SNARE coiled-coil homology domain-containing protein n=1 Tax=Plectus sambesii TaxID=2011161 RepID=A0A914VXA0_9BILA
MGTLSVQPPSGATRSLTEVFILLRNNAVQSRHIFANPSGFGGRGEERMSLVPLGEDGDAEAGLGPGHSSRIPPEWVNIVDEIQYEMTRIRNRLKDLKEMQQKHMTRPSFNDDSSQEEEAKIEAATQEVTKMLSHCQRLVGAVKQFEHSGAKHNDMMLLRNVVSSLLMLLQNLTLEFRQSQTRYLKQIETREDNFQQYFSDFNGDAASEGWAGDKMHTRGVGNLPPTHSYPFFDEPSGSSGAAVEEDGELTMAQIQQLAENASMVKDREKEILHITKSIVNLNSLFKDLAGLVVDQGTILDRIDYNVEQATVRVKSGLQQVQKAEQYQRKNRKMHCIMILSVTIIVLLLLLVAIKS